MPAFVQAGTAFAAASATPVSVTITTKEGNCLLAIVVGVFSTTITSVTDTAGNVWERVQSIVQGVDTVELWRTVNPKAHAVTRVDANFSGANNNVVIVAEYSGVDSYGATAKAGPTTSTSPTLSITTGSNTVVFFGFSSASTGGIAASTGTKRAEQIGNTESVAAYENTGGPGSVTATGTTASAEWVAVGLELVTVILEQSAYRFHNDDGNEHTATFAANENTTMTAAKNTNKRARVQINVTGDPVAKSFQIEYRKQGSTVWHKVGE